MKLAEHDLDESTAKSLPARGAWVETVPFSAPRTAKAVAPRKGSVG